MCTLVDGNFCLEILFPQSLRFFYPEKGGDRLLRKAYNYLQNFDTDDGGSKFLQNADNYQPKFTLKLEVAGTSEPLVTICHTCTLKVEVAGYTASYHRRQQCL
jgi:hypothetical protein